MRGPVDPDTVTLADLAGPQAAATLARLRAGGPVTWVPVLAGWLVTAHATAVDVMRDAGTFTVDHPGFSTAQVVGPSMLSTDGPTHLRHRRPFGHAFRPSASQRRFGPQASSLAADLVAAVRPAGRADLRTALAGPLSAAVVAAALGMDTRDTPTMLRWYAAIVGAVTDITGGRPPRAEAAEAMAALDLAVRATIGGDAGSLLATARPTLTASEVTSNAAVLMFGGIDTTEGMIASALLHLLGHPSAWEAVRRDRALIGPAVEESLRLEPAAAVVDRYATRDVAIGTARVRSGDLVRVSVTAANRDPSVFPDPDTFDLQRSGRDEHLAFARGPHTCIASHLARLETVAAIEAVLDGLPGVRLVGAPAATGLVFRKPQALPVVWDPTG